MVKIAGIRNFWPATSRAVKLDRWRLSKKLFFFFFFSTSVREKHSAWAIRKERKNLFRNKIIGRKKGRQKTSRQKLRNRRRIENPVFVGRTWESSGPFLNTFFFINRLVLPTNLNRCTHSMNSPSISYFRHFLFSGKKKKATGTSSRPWRLCVCVYSAAHFEIFCLVSEIVYICYRIFRDLFICHVRRTWRKVKIRGTC